MSATCPWCLSRDHRLADCSKVKAFREATTHGVTDPMHDEEPLDLAMRCIRLRAALRGALADLHAAGLEPSQVTRSLIPAHEGLDV